MTTESNMFSNMCQGKDMNSPNWPDKPGQKSEKSKSQYTTNADTQEILSTYPVGAHTKKKLRGNSFKCRINELSLASIPQILLLRESHPQQYQDIV